MYIHFDTRGKRYSRRRARDARGKNTKRACLPSNRQPQGPLARAHHRHRTPHSVSPIPSFWKNRDTLVPGVVRRSRMCRTGRPTRPDTRILCSSRKAERIRRNKKQKSKVFTSYADTVGLCTTSEHNVSKRGGMQTRS